MWSESTLPSCEPSRWTWSLVDVGWGRSSWNSKKGLFLFLSAVFQVSISLQNPDNLKVDWLYFHFFLQIKLFSNAARNCPEITCICSSESHPAASLRVDRLHVWWEQQRRGSLLPAAPLIPEVMVAMAMMARRRPHDSVICRGCAFRFEWCGRRRESESHTWVPDGCPLFPPAHCPRSAPLPRDPIAHTPSSLLHPLSLKHAAHWIYVVCICNRIITGRRPVWTQSEGEFQVRPTDKRLATASNTCTCDPLSPSTQFRLIWHSDPIEHRVENLCKPWPGPDRWSSQWITFCMCGMFKAKKVGI